MLATHDWLTSRRLISININYQLMIYLKLYLNCNTINMIISLIVKIIRYCLSLRQLEVDFWQGHHQYPCCSQCCTFKASRTFYTKYRIYYLSIYLASPALFRREDWTQEAVLRQCVPGAGHWMSPQVCVHWSHFCIRPLSDCQLSAASCEVEMWPPARSRTDWAQAAPAPVTRHSSSIPS